MKTYEITNIGQLVTMRGPNRPRRGPELSDIGIVHDAVIQYDDEKITYVGSRSDAPQVAIEDDCRSDAAGYVVTPGLIDAHTHAVFAGSRADEFEQRALGATYQEIAAKGGGIMSSVRQTRAATWEKLGQDSLSHIDMMRACGTTTVEIKSGYGLDLANEKKMLEVAGALNSESMRVVRTFLGTHAVPPEFDSKDEYVDHVLNQMLPTLKDECEFVDIFVEKGYFAHDDARRLSEVARGFGLGLRLHVDQMRDSGGARLAAELGAVTADHLEFTGDDGILALAQSNTLPVLLPGSVYGIRSDKYPDARKMIELGLPLVIATDFNPGSSPTPSLPFCMSLAMTKMGMSVAECLSACTINAAYSLNLGDQIGSLEPGKVADFIIWKYDDYREIPYWISGQPDLTVFNGGFTH